MAELRPTQWSVKVPPLTQSKVFGQGINHISPQVPDTSSPPFTHMIAGKVIISMKALHDCRTESPVCIAQTRFSCSLQKVSQGSRPGLGFASLPQSGHRKNRATSKLHSDSGKARPLSLQQLWFALTAFTTQAGSHTWTLHLLNVWCLDTATMLVSKNSSSSVFDLTHPFWKHTHRKSGGKLPARTFKASWQNVL